MSMRRQTSTSLRWRRLLLAASLSLAWPLAAIAQSSADMPANPPMPMDQMAIPGMSHDTKPEAKHDAMPATKPAAKPGMNHGSSTSTKDTRSPDYSDGTARGSMPGMDMLDHQPLGMLKIDQLEFTDGRYTNGQAWDVEGWYGYDSDKLWLRSEGDAEHGRIEEGQVEALWSHAVAAFWNIQFGVRQDVGEGLHRQWAAFGIQGLAPYWFELEATGYLGPSGRTAARFRAEYELLFTQRLILQPEFELNLYGSDDPANRVGSGLSDTQLGLRLRYEVSRQFAPYIGIVWIHRHGATADYAWLDGQPSMDRQWVAGLRIWF
ncbi:copper resistance protein B [Rhodanobacter sp. C05]|uniref:copper resistance protein B n=1 Tax=Rhodanobacter sp. C05 TaxID=1945855 RepID=UPI0009861740|nr:copper resistance protein B [Rhodanobacter sp. C05]OOG38373.1 copper resistance protein CopB [Rhodanobacter sp. C05]